MQSLMDEQVYRMYKINEGYKPSNPVLTELQQTKALKLMDKFDQRTKSMGIVDVKNGFDTINTVYSNTNIEDATGFDDIAAINAFQRMIDPGATVREGDVELLEKTIPFLARVSPSYNWKKFSKGDKLPFEIRKNLKKVSDEVFETKAREFDRSVGNRFKAQAEQAGIPFYFVGESFSKMEDMSVRRSRDIKDKVSNVIEYDRATQCGAFVNDELGLTGENRMGDTLNSKIDSITSTDPIIDGYFVMDTGTPFGHTGLVDGEDDNYIYIRDRNYNGDGVERKMRIEKDSEFYNQIIGYGK